MSRFYNIILCNFLFLNILSAQKVEAPNTGADVEPNAETAARKRSRYIGFDPLDWSVEMQEIPAGNYLLQDGYLVYISEFRIARFQVTRQLYHSVMRLPKPATSELYKPVVGVSWYDALRFCNELSRLAGLQPAYLIRELRYPSNEDFRYEVKWQEKSTGYRLLTEAEWEYAARSMRRKFMYSGSNTADTVAWYNGNTKRLQPVGLKQPNEIGLYDMSGNAWDWVWDRFVQLHLSDLAEPQRLEPDKRSGSRITPDDLRYDSQLRTLSQNLDQNIDKNLRERLVWRGPDVYEGRVHQERTAAELRTCRGGGWNFAKKYSTVLRRSPCIARADYYVSVSFRIAQTVF